MYMQIKFTCVVDMHTIPEFHDHTPNKFFVKSVAFLEEKNPVDSAGNLATQGHLMTYIIQAI